MQQLFKGYISDQLSELLSMQFGLQKNLDLARDRKDVDAILLFRNQLLKVDEMIEEITLALLS